MMMRKFLWLLAALTTLLHAISYCSVALANDSHYLTIEDARHLITRTGFGASPYELQQLIGKSRIEAVASIVNGLDGNIHTTTPAWFSSNAPHHYHFNNLSTTDKLKFRQARLKEIQSLRRWWVNEMISTPKPQKERLLLFWQNHFATAFSAINNHSISIARQHLILRENTAGNFRVMLKNIIRDPAMLNYLDNNNSKKQKPNENFARELLELFALGEGNYTEADVKNAARALTGYSFSDTYDMRFVFKPWAHDNSTKTLFGKSGEFNGEDLVDLILEQPAAAKYITAKLWRMLIGDIKQTDEKLTAHANAFRNSDYDIKTLYKRLLLSDTFWDASNRASLVKSPVSLIVGTIRSTGILPTDWQTLPSRLRQMGQHLFEPPNVAGWPGGASWITPGRLLTRLDWLEQLDMRTAAAKPVSMAMNSESMTMTDQAQNPIGTSDSNTMTTKNAMAAVNSMATVNTMAAENTMANNTDGVHQLAIKMASEEFDEHVRYRVKAYGQGNSVWDSGTVELTGGHDTKRMGRVNQRNLPWQTISFPIHIPAKDITAIEITFLNDGTTPSGADRNLFISHATLDNRVWLATEGKQTGKCPRNKPGQQGNLFCPGTLKMVASQTSAISHPAQPNANTIRASSIGVNYVQPVNRKHKTELAFTLSDLEFEGRFWDTLKVVYVKHKTGHAIKLSSTSCWPACVIEWPACSHKNEHSITTLSLELEKTHEQCMYNGLQEPDKKLARALWMILPDLYNAGHNDSKIRRPNIARNYNKWRSTVDEMQSQLPSSAFFDDAIILEIAPRPIIDTTLNEVPMKPLPANRTSKQRDADLNQLIKRNPSVNLATLLLPTAPTDKTLSNSTELESILTDLSFQLQ